MTTLNKTEKTEPMMVTWGRIRTAAHQLKHPRLIALIEKFNKDLGANMNEPLVKQII